MDEKTCEWGCDMFTLPVDLSMRGNGGVGSHEYHVTGTKLENSVTRHYCKVTDLITVRLGETNRDVVYYQLCLHVVMAECHYCPRNEVHSGPWHRKRASIFVVPVSDVCFHLIKNNCVVVARINLWCRQQCIKPNRSNFLSTIPCLLWIL